jgi:ribosome-binding ATPase
VIHLELALADLETVTRNHDRAVKAAKTGRKEDVLRRDLLARIAEHLDGGQPVRSMALEETEQELIRDLHLLTAKPTLYIANVAEDGFSDNPYLDTVVAIAAAEGAEVVPVCAAIEAEISQLDDADKGEFLAELGLAEAGLDRVIRAGFRLLGLQTFFTVGPKEVRAWTVPVGATAPQAAGEIHTDFQRGFIRAEVIAYPEFIACGGEGKAKESGKLRLEGKEYIVKDGDVMHFRFNV